MWIGAGSERRSASQSIDWLRFGGVNPRAYSQAAASPWVADARRSASGPGCDPRNLFADILQLIAELRPSPSGIDAQVRVLKDRDCQRQR